MKLYGYWRSSSSWRVRIALEVKGVPFVYQPVNLLRGEQNGAAYRGINPRGEVPALEVEVGGVVHHLAQSVAIIEYLDERFPEPALLPRDAIARAVTRQIVEIVNSGIQPLHNNWLLGIVRDELHADEKAWARRHLERGLAALEALARQASGRFMVGDAVTMADVCLVPQLYAARRFGADLSQAPTLTRVEAACSALPPFQRAHAEAQIDAEPAPR